MTATPTEVPGFAMPAEWATHRRTWIAWPHQRGDWPDKFEPIPWVYAEIVRRLVGSERVGIVALAAQETEARGLLERAGVDGTRIDFLTAATDRVWLRDSGAIFVRDGAGARVALDFRFNGWAKYDNHSADDALAPQIAAYAGVPSLQPRWGERRIVLEGGAFDVNGAGLLLTTEECLLSPIQARNPGLEREELTQALRHWLGAERILWLHRGIAGDDTHGHVDDLARFVSERVVVLVQEEDPGDENYEPLRENRERLRAMTDLDGRPLEVVTLPMPAPLYLDGQRLPASYANFYIANKCVLLPTFNDANDRRALNTLAELFPGREVVGIHAVDLVWGLGTLHCLTQQEPAGGDGG